MTLTEFFLEFRLRVLQITLARSIVTSRTSAVVAASIKKPLPESLKERFKASTRVKGHSASASRVTVTSGVSLASSEAVAPILPGPTSKE